MQRTLISEQLYCRIIASNNTTAWNPDEPFKHINKQLSKP